MPVNNQELLIDHLDKKMQGESLPEAEALLQTDSNAREEWQYLQAHLQEYVQPVFPPSPLSQQQAFPCLQTPFCRWPLLFFLLSQIHAHAITL